MPDPVEAGIAESPSLILGIIVLFFVSLIAAYLPVASQHSTYLHVPRICFFFAQYFGTGVIISTALTHLLNDAFVKLSSVRWLGFKHWPGMIVLLSMLAIFLVDFCSDACVRYLKSRELPDLEHREQYRCDQLLFSPDSKCQVVTSDGDFTEVREDTPLLESGTRTVTESLRPKGEIISLLTLQIGILMHSIVLGLTLAVSTPAKFASLLPAILFHQTFEGFAVGMQLAAFAVPHRIYRHTGVTATELDDDDPSRNSTCCDPSPSSSRRSSPSPVPQSRCQILLPRILAIFFAIPMPFVMCIVLSIRQFQPSASPVSTSSLGSPTKADILQGTTCAVSAGLLIYVGMVELVAGQFRYNGELQQESAWKQFGAVVSFIAGSLGMGIIG